VKIIRLSILTAISLIVILSTGVFATDYQGTVKLGYLYLDHEGNRGVNQSSFNLYEGMALSLERFSAFWDNGYHLHADLKNVSLNNRNLSFNAGRTGLANISFRHTSYRRLYDFDGDRETKRRQTNAKAWWQAHEWFRLYGDIGANNRKGEAGQLFEPGSTTLFDNIDYKNYNYGIGLTFQRERTAGNLEYRGSDFTDDLDDTNDRTSRRIRASISSPVPNYENLLLNGGYQHYQLKLENKNDTLKTHTFWGGARIHFNQGYHIRYSFIFDRAERTGDFIESDNITHAFNAGKTWRGQGGISLGYKYHLNDDLFDERSGYDWSVSGWLKIKPDITCRAGYGTETMEVDEGHTLTGQRDRDRAWASVRYRFDNGWMRFKLSNHQTNNDDIQSSADFFKMGVEGSLDMPDYGNLSAAYSYHDGDYTSSTDRFEFAEHVLSGDIISREYRNLQAGLGGTYLRSKKDTDVESYGLRIFGRYMLPRGLGLEIAYSTHNFDNLNDPSPTYTEYYTDNIVEVSLSYKL